MTNEFFVINRRGKKYDLRTFNGDDIFIKGLSDRPVAKPPAFLNTATAVSLQKLQIGTDERKKLTAEKSSIYYFFIGGDCFGPYHLSKDKQYVMVSGGPGEAIVCIEDAVDAAKSKLNHQTPEEVAVGADKTQETIDTVMQIIWKVATGLMAGVASAMPDPVTQIMGGATSNTMNTLGSLMFMGFGATKGEVPAGPGIMDIENALRYVVQEAEARNDGSLFMSAYRGFQERAAEIGALLPDRAATENTNRWRQKSPIPDHLMKDLEESVDRALSVESGDTFASRLEYQTSNPESARFILPQLMVAMGLYLHLKRLHIGITYLPARFAKGPKQLPPASVFRDLLDRVTEMKSGLTKARESFASFADSLMPTGLPNTLEAISVIKVANKHFFGEENALHHPKYLERYTKFEKDYDELKEEERQNRFYSKDDTLKGDDKIDVAINNLNKIADGLQADIDLIEKEKKWPKNLLNLKFEDDPVGAT